MNSDAGPGPTGDPRPELAPRAIGDARPDPARRPADRALAWLVTGPLGRGTAFAIDFAVAARTMLAARRARR